MCLYFGIVLHRNQLPVLLVQPEIPTAGARPAILGTVYSVAAERLVRNPGGGYRLATKDASLAQGLCEPIEPLGCPLVAAELLHDDLDAILFFAQNSRRTDRYAFLIGVANRDFYF